jgi:hypothetical protein
LIECELVLALVLFFGFRPKISWFVTTILFAVFSIVSLYKGISGAESCGCLGALNVNPFLMFGIDVVIVGLLLLFRPSNQFYSIAPSNTDVKKNGFVQGLKIVFVVVLVSMVQFLLFFPLQNINQILDTNEITFEVDETSELQKRDNKYTIGIFITNHTSRPISIVGAKTDCSCGAIYGIPKKIGPHEKVCISFVTSDKPVERKIELSKEKQMIMFFASDFDGIRRISVALPIFEYLVRSEKSL